jgi:hypothetical protein
MISKLTKKQEAQIPKFIDKYLKLAEKPTDRKKATKAVQALYKSAGYKKPIVIFGRNPFETAIMVAMYKTLFKNDLVKEDSQLYSQLRSQLRSQLSSQLSSQLDSQLDSQLGSQLSSQLDSQLSKINNDWWLIVWWLVWAGWYSYAQYIGVKFDNKVLKIFMDFVTNVSFIIPYEGIAFVSETPIKINWDNKQLHSTTSMSVEYAGDWGLYSIHGVKFTKEQFEKSKTATVAEILSWEDIDQRSVLLRDRPIDELLKETPKKLIDHSDECGGYDLYEIEIELRKGEKSKARIMYYKSWSSDKMYAKFVPIDSKKCLETIAKLRGLSVEELLNAHKS